MKDVTPPGVFVVRPARPGDLPEAARLAAELVRLHHRFDPLRFMCIEPIEKGYERFMATQIDREDVVILVAVTEAAGAPVVIGYLIASLEERDWSDLRDACGKIHDVYVAARRLVVDALARLAALGAPRVVLMTAWQNEDARKLFDTLGFRPTMIEMTRESTPMPTEG
jgi:ribosomal protein S18 acetylase RimI-like enzyme